MATRLSRFSLQGFFSLLPFTLFFSLLFSFRRLTLFFTRFYIRPVVSVGFIFIYFFIHFVHISEWYTLLGRVLTP